MAKMHSVPACIWGFKGFESCLSLKDLCILSQTRKDWQEPVVALYNSPRVQQLVQALKASVPRLHIRPELRRLLEGDDSPYQLLHQLWRFVSFLHDIGSMGRTIAVAPGLLADFTQLHAVPRLSKSVIQRFVQHMRTCISYQQLLTAANNRVDGIEVWVQVQHELGIKADIPDIIIKICCRPPAWQSLDWLKQWQPASQQDFVDAMQIALNCTSATVPLTHIESVADVLLPQIKDVASVLYLLPTATARDHVKVLQAVFKLPVMQQLQPAAVLQLMQAEAAVNTKQGYAGWSRVLIMELLAQLPAASKLALGSVMPLLQAAIAACHNHAVKALCSLPATASVPVADVMKMLLAALDSGLDGVVAHLSSLPAASNMSPDDWTRIFTSAISYKADCDYAALCKLPAADLAAQEVVVDLLRSAVHAQLYAAAVALLALPAADSIPQEHVFQCMQKLAAQAAAIRQGYGHLVRGPCKEPSATAEDTLAALCKLEALQDVSSMQLLELLDCIVQHDNYEASYTLELLSQLPAARSIPADVMRQQMQEAVQQERFDLLSALCQCPSAANVDADTLLQCILQTDAAEWNTQRQLCKLAADQHLNSSQLKTIMLKFIDDSQCPWRFLDGKLAAAAQLTSEDVAELLSAAVKHNLIRSVEMLCKLKAARALSSSTIARLISGALDHPHAAGVVKALCSLPAAQDIPEDAAAELTHKAEQSGDRRNVTALLILRPRQSQRLRRQG